MKKYWNELEDGTMQWQDRDGNPVEAPQPYSGPKGKGMGTGKPTGWPLECEASGVHHTQRRQLEKFMSDNGCPTEVNEHGNPLYTSQAHRKKAFRVRGIYDKHASYGDAEPLN